MENELMTTVGGISDNSDRSIRSGITMDENSVAYFNSDQ